MQLVFIKVVVFYLYARRKKIIETINLYELDRIIAKRKEFVLRKDIVELRQLIDKKLFSKYKSFKNVAFKIELDKLSSYRMNNYRIILKAS